MPTQIENGKTKRAIPDDKPTAAEVHHALTQEHLARTALDDAELAAFDLMSKKDVPYQRAKAAAKLQTMDRRKVWERKRRDLVVVYYRANGQIPRADELFS